MKNFLILLLLLFLVAGCSAEKDGLEALLTEKMREDKDQQDYNLQPDEMASCVLDKIDRQIPGFTIGTNHDHYYSAFSQFLKAKGGKELLNILKQSGTVFGSEQKAREILLSVSDHVIDCMGALHAPSGES